MKFIKHLLIPSIFALALSACSKNKRIVPDQPASELYAVAQKALSEGNFREAITQLEAATSISLSCPITFKKWAPRCRPDRNPQSKTTPFPYPHPAKRGRTLEGFLPTPDNISSRVCQAAIRGWARRY